MHVFINRYRTQTFACKNVHGWVEVLQRNKDDISLLSLSFESSLSVKEKSKNKKIKK